MGEASVIERPLPSAPAAQPNGRWRKLRPAILQILAMIGIGTMVYSSAAGWFAARSHNADISGYTASVEQLQPEQRSQALELAREYNQHLPQGILRDPYTAGADSQNEVNAAQELYEQLLAVAGTDAIGHVSYPALGIALPIYHGTSNTVLRKGVGHLYGSSLPVGGPSTHSVMTSHSGLVHARLFTNLLKAQVGQTFSVTALGETRYYQVTNTDTILPDQTETLQIVPGEDLITLFTCTPIGVNSHRFIVQGKRVDPPDTSGRQAIPRDGHTAGFPWWLLIFLAGSATTAYLIYAPPKGARQKGSTARHAAGRRRSS